MAVRNARQAGGWSGVRSVRAAAEIGLTIALALLAARLVGTMLRPEAFATLKIVESATLPAGAGTNPFRVDTGLLLLTNPFSGASGTASADVPADDAPETDLNLVLRGVRAASGAKAVGTAFIVTPDNRLGAYLEGQEIIAGLVRLERVLSDRVILDRNGERESLRLNDDAGPDGLRVLSDARAPQSVEGARDVTAERQSRPALVGRVRDPLALIGSVTLAPEAREGRMIGYGVAALPGAQVPAETGLEAGDIILRINDMRLAGASLDSVLGSLSGEKELRVAVLRGGQEIMIRVEVGDE